MSSTVDQRSRRRAQAAGWVGVGAAVLVFVVGAIVGMATMTGGRRQPGTTVTGSIRLDAPRVGACLPGKVRVEGTVIAGYLERVFIGAREVKRDNSMLAEGPRRWVLADGPSLVSAGRFAGELELPDGYYEIGILPEEDASVTLATVLVGIDTEPPVVEIDQPVAGEVIAAPAFLVRGVITDENPEKVWSLAGGEADLDLEGNFAAAVELRRSRTGEAPDAAGDEGPRVVEVVGRDRAGNETRASVDVILDLTEPVLRIDQPAPGAVINGASVRVVGQLVDANPAGALAIDGVPVSGLAPDGRFEVEVNIAVEGTRTIRITAEDAAGRIAMPVELEVTVDRTPPVVALEAPADGLRTAEASIELRGSVQDPHSPLRVRAGEASQTLGADGRFALRVPLAPGENAIELVALDGAGNETTTKLTVVRE